MRGNKIPKLNKLIGTKILRYGREFFFLIKLHYKVTIKTHVKTRFTIVVH